MNLTLTRDQDNGDMTFGVITIGDGIICQTLERPWLKHDTYRAGTPFKSCIPAGDYGLEPFQSGKFGNTYALENADLGVFSHKGQCERPGDRYGILIHVANWVNELQGCIAPGQRRSPQDKPNMLHNSRIAMADLLDELAHDEVNLLRIEYA
jgi:hypothetical protein